jgi:hypothetical protein
MVGAHFGRHVCHNVAVAEVHRPIHQVVYFGCGIPQAALTTTVGEIDQPTRRVCALGVSRLFQQIPVVRSELSISSLHEILPRYDRHQLVILCERCRIEKLKPAR